MGHESFVFRKTERGKREIATPSGSLSPKHRRCLILLDGTKSVADLIPLFRPNELARVVSDLQASGLIEASGGAVFAPDTPLPDLPPLDPALFIELRRRASREVAVRLGAAGPALAASIQACNTPAALRVLLREAETIMAPVIGPDEALALVKKIGRDLVSR
jgi:hypothetical protein